MIWYKINKVIFELSLTEEEKELIENTIIVSLGEDRYYIEHDDEGGWDSYSIAPFLRKAKKSGVIVVDLNDGIEDYAQDTYFFGKGYFESP